MRDILFRGKRLDNGEWAESPCHLGTMASGTVLHDFDPATVDQYTGLTDKNGVKIFEGDIVDGIDFSAEDGYGLVRWDDGAFEVIGNGARGAFYEDYWGKDFEVIGNIHDNPELMEE